MTTRAESLFGRIVAAVRVGLPRQIDAEYFDGFLARFRAPLIGVIERAFAAKDLRSTPPDAWTPGARTKANIEAMVLAAALASKPRALTADDKRTLATYSGWGGLSIEKAAGQLPEGFPRPESRGLIHEFYTPTKVVNEVARVVRPLLPGLEQDGKILALEPSAGIGRFVRAFSGPGFDEIEWHAVEYSALSAAMLRALRPEIDLFEGPFERWVAKHGEAFRGKLQLVVQNPPYGARGASVADDPAREYREKKAYAYFLRRALDLLAPNGLGVVLIPSGFLTGRSTELHALRQKVLRRHHLSAAYRLPSGLFPGAMLVTDLLFFRARGGTLPEVDEADKPILDGHYFRDNPSHILGKEIGKVGDDDDQTAKPRYGYQIEGEFTGLPDLAERPVCGQCELVHEAQHRAATKSRGIARRIDEATDGLVEELALAVTLGVRVDGYLAGVASSDAEWPALAWRELRDALIAWTDKYGVPAKYVDLVKLAKENAGAARFLTAFDRSGKLIPGIAEQPVFEARFAGDPRDLPALGSHLFRQRRYLAAGELLDAAGYKPGSAERKTAWRRIRVEMLDTGAWAVKLTAPWSDTSEAPAWELEPAEVFYTGSLWPKVDAMRDIGGPIAERQLAKLLEAIKPAMFDEIEFISPRQGWVPLDLVSAWLNETFNRYYSRIELVREAGLVQVRGVSYEKTDDSDLRPDVIDVIGWINHDRTLFKPKVRKGDSVDDKRLEKAKEWDQSFRAWASVDDKRKVAIEQAYQRNFQGWATPMFSAEPLALARWVKDGPQLHPHQVAGARRVIANRGGLVAFDVGVGKTYTGLAVLARARQEGWSKRPVLLVPNSIAWKWEADIRRVLPDYRVAVIGSKRKVIARGERKGFATSETDSPSDRAAKWSRFQAGEYDVVILTYTALGRTKMNDEAIRKYADATDAIQREVALRRRNLQGRKKLTEREEAILKEGMAGWVAEQMEIPEGWEYDPGIAWDDIGIDLLIVDEAQSYKNLYLPEAREGGVPRFMGNAGEGSKRAWQLDFRCAAVRRHTGGAGVVLLSATPAKNSPLEFYSLIQYIDHDAWNRIGIRDPEQFIDRYCRIELKSVVDSSMNVVERSAVVGFQNLHELRDVIFRYGEFKTAEDVGLKLPEPTVNMIRVDMDADQEAKYDRYVAEIERAMESTNPGDKAAILGLLARMALVAIHSKLDEKFTWKTAADASVSPKSPKFKALAEQIKTIPTCGHIVFCDNIAAHVWIRRTLVDAGIPADRIGVLNAEVAQASADRQRIAAEFNGDPELGVQPKYDVVIANAIAYEGIDLQTRTCAIHHIDLPWEPATLQQRNGRAVRQGNRLATISLNYYFANRSQDGMRFNLIQGKRGWMTELLTSQARATNNPGAQMDMGPEEMLLLISRDPEKTLLALAKVKERKELEARARIAVDANRTLRAANSRYRRAEKVSDPSESARLRSEADQRLEDLARVDPSAWPWASWAYAARDHDMLIPDEGAPVWEGLRIAVPSAIDPTIIQYAEFGRIQPDGTIGARVLGKTAWGQQSLDQLKTLGLRPEHLTETWPENEGALQATLLNGVQNAWSAEALAVGLASNVWMERWWPVIGAKFLAKMATVQWQSLWVPMEHNRRLAWRLASQGTASGGEPLPPTLAGFQRFVELAPTAADDVTYTEHYDRAWTWWARRVPRNLLSSAEEAP